MPRVLAIAGLEIVNARRTKKEGLNFECFRII